MPKSADEIIHGALSHAYDAKKAHDYYEAHKHLKGRKTGGKVIPLKGAHKPAHPTAPGPISPAVQQRIDELKGRLAALTTRLRELLANKSKPEHKTAADKSAEARASKKYRDAHKSEIANKRKQDAAKSGGGSKSSGGIGSMTEVEVRAAIARTRSELQAAVANARAAANRGTA